MAASVHPHNQPSIVRVPEMGDDGNYPTDSAVRLENKVNLALTTRT